ncbi:MAG: hypothetical protein WC497_05625 [Patescibacteria group bacterium]
MKLNLPSDRPAFRIPDRKGERATDETIPAGIHDFVEIPNPDGGTGAPPWLVLATDRKVGLSKPALLRTPGLKVVPEPAPADPPPAV